MERDLVRVYLYGDLAERFGQQHEFAISTPREAVSALCANYKGFRQAMVQYERYAIHADGDWREVEDAAILPVSRELHLVPLIEGHAVAAPLAAAAMPILMNIGTQLLIGVVISALMWGVGQLFNKPKEAVTDEEKSESYMFSGSLNTVTQGSAVPVIYGRMYVGSVVVSAGISTSDQQIATTGAGQGLLLREEVPTEPDAPMLLSAVEPDMPPIVLQNVAGSEEAPVQRLGPEGWRHVGVVSILDEEITREVELWVPPEAGLPYKWDYFRGFTRYQPGETGLTSMVVP